MYLRGSRTPKSRKMRMRFWTLVSRSAKRQANSEMY